MQRTEENHRTSKIKRFLLKKRARFRAHILHKNLHTSSDTPYMGYRNLCADFCPQGGRENETVFWQPNAVHVLLCRETRFQNHMASHQTSQIVMVRSAALGDRVWPACFGREPLFVSTLVTNRLCMRCMTCMVFFKICFPLCIARIRRLTQCSHGHIRTV